MPHFHPRLSRALCYLLPCLAGLAIPPVAAGVNTINFNTDSGNPPWWEIGGVTQHFDFGASGQPGDGYLSITDAQPNLQSVAVFKDLENGLVIYSVRMEADLRLGGGDAVPGEGFSLNFAAAGDPIVANVMADPAATPHPGWSGTLNEPGRDHGRTGPGTPAEGTATGLAIGFDLVASGPLFPASDGEDVEGISIRVDGNLIAQFPVPLQPGNATPNPTPFRNLPADDPHYSQSLQTGALNPNRVDGSGDNESWKNLRWDRFTAEVDDSGRVRISWKGVELTPLGGLPTSFRPSVSRIVLGARTGATSQNHHIDNIKLTTMGTAPALGVGNPSGFAYGFSIPVAGTGAALNSLVIKRDGQVIPGAITQEFGNQVWKSSLLDPLLPPHTDVELEIQYCDTFGACFNETRRLVVPNYETIPSDYRLGGEATGDGFNVSMRQVESRSAARALATRVWDDNSIVVAESQISGAFGENLIDEATSGPNGVLATPLVGVINWERDGAAQGNFFVSNTHPDAKIPGVPGHASEPADNLAAVVTTYLKLKKGYHRMGVNSADGFRVSAGFDQLGLRLGAFDGGRFASDTTFDFAADADGWYPFRLSWWAGQNGASLEWYSVDLGTGIKTLINDDSVAGFVDAAPGGTGAPYIQLLSPYPGFTAAAPDSVKVVLWGTIPPLNVDSITLSVDGAPVGVTKTVDGANVTVTYTPAQKFSFGSSHTVELYYGWGGGLAQSSRRLTYGFQVRGAGPGDLPPSFVIEAEDFDQNGQAIPGTNAQPLQGGLAAGRGARLGMDYNHFGQNQDDNYRTGEGDGTKGFNVPIYTNTGEPLDTQRPGPNGTYEVTPNYALGWAGTANGNNHWANYTRDIPIGNYRVYAALSHGDTNAWMRGSLHQVTSGMGTTNQTTGLLGVFAAPASGGWGNSVLVPMQTPAREPAVVPLGGRMTLRFDYPAGDFDYLLLVPTLEPVAANPLHEPGTFIVEAEDFNFGGGQIEPAANVMPYAGGAYAGRGAVAGVDYFRSDNQEVEDTYRTGESPNVPMMTLWSDKESDRGLFQVRQNWVVRFAGEHWYNYTRQLPAGFYRVFAGVSHGAAPTQPDAVQGRFQRITDGPAANAGQTVENLGSFVGAGTAGWENDYLFPLRQPDGKPVVLQSAGGSQTFRLTASAGDFDFLAFVPTRDPDLPPLGVELAPPMGFKNVALNRLTRTLLADLDPDRAMGFITIRPGAKILSARIEGNRLVVTYE